MHRYPNDSGEWNLCCFVTDLLSPRILNVVRPVSFLKKKLRISNPFCSSRLNDSLSGPDVESFTTEITLQVPTQADLRHKLASLSSTCTDSASQDTEAGEEEEYNDDDDDEDDEREQAANRGSLLIQPDLEEVEEDARLLEREQNWPIKNCESSSSS